MCKPEAARCHRTPAELVSSPMSKAHHLRLCTVNIKYASDIKMMLASLFLQSVTECDSASKGGLNSFFLSFLLSFFKACVVHKFHFSTVGLHNAIWRDTFTLIWPNKIACQPVTTSTFRAIIKHHHNAAKRTWMRYTTSILIHKYTLFQRLL